jgi:hypothetical protein
MVDCQDAGNQLLIPDPFWNVFLFILIVLAASVITLPLYRAVARFTLWMGMVPLRSALLLAILILVRWAWRWFPRNSKISPIGLAPGWFLPPFFPF